MNEALNNIVLYFVIPMFLICSVAFFADIYYLTKDYTKARKLNDIKEKQ